MVTDLKGIRERLVESYDPDRIILFCSRAGEKCVEGKDIELVIVKETEKRPLERLSEVEALLAHRAPPIEIVVYTPEEMRALYSRGVAYVKGVVDTGILLYEKCHA